MADPMTQVLVARARVAQALQTRPLLEVERAVEGEITGDPMIAVMLARALEVAGQRVGGAMVSASRRCGPGECGGPACSGAVLVRTSRRPRWGKRVWRTYLDLQPNGDKTGRARARMGRR